jgi:tetratricopeptide (TPR) repeat protein
MGLLSGFNPHELPEATVYAVATGRKDDLRDILRDVQTNLGADTLQHLIVSGPRGYGKSFLMRHIQLDLQHKAKESGWNVAVVMMPEEMPHVREPETLIREITRIFEGGDSNLTELSWHEDDGAAWDSAVAALEAAIDQRLGKGGLLVALVENFDVVLRNAFPKTIHANRLREFLTRKGGQVMLITASATGAFDRDYDKPLFQAFKEITLAPWSVEQCLSFFDRQRAAAGRGPLEGAMLGRATAVASFIGGTPRLATLLGEALLDEDVLKAADLLQRLVDELTPYYKERVEALPGRSQKLLDALLRYGEPATQSELARRVNAKSQAAIAGPFSTLIQERIVTGVKAPGSAEVLYRVADRVFAHFYRRRTITHGNQACALEALVDLLAEYFTPDEMKAKVAEFANADKIYEARLLARLYKAAIEDELDDQKIILHSLMEFYVPYWFVPISSHPVAAAIKESAARAAAGDLDKSRELLIRAQAQAVTNTDEVVLLLARSRLDAAEGVDGGLAASREALQVSEPNSIAHTYAMNSIVLGLNDTGQHQKALSLAQNLISKTKASGSNLLRAEISCQLAKTLSSVKRYDESADVAFKAASLAKASGNTFLEVKALLAAAFSLSGARRYDKAISAAKQALAIHRLSEQGGGQSATLWFIAIQYSQSMHDEEAINTAIEAASYARAEGNEKFELLSYAVAVDTALLTSPTQIWPIPELGKIGRFDPKSVGKLAVSVGLRTAFLFGKMLSESGISSKTWHDVLFELSLVLSGSSFGRVLLQGVITSMKMDLIHYEESPERLELAAEVIELRLESHFADEAAQLRTAACYHRSGRDLAVLARIDPDQAEALRIMHPPGKGPAPKKKQTKK